MRATTDIQVYDRALADAGATDYVIGGRGYWEQPQVIQLTVTCARSPTRWTGRPGRRRCSHRSAGSHSMGWCYSPPVPVSGSRHQTASVSSASNRGSCPSERWPRGSVSSCCWNARSTSAATRSRWSRCANGRRRLANVRKLMRLAREWETANGSDLQGFLRLIRTRATADGVRESEAPVESESLNAVRLMTIHRSKGLEFPVVCVADLAASRPITGAV